MLSEEVKADYPFPSSSLNKFHFFNFVSWVGVR
jgi:hypothetical protein